MGGSLERAKLYARDATGAKISDEFFDENGIEVCFNPKDYTLDKTINWQPGKAKDDAPTVNFNEPAPMDLSVTLQFDTYEEGVSVREKWVRKIERLALMRKVPQNQEDMVNCQPPLVLFVWGNFRFQGVITSLQQKYTMFLQDGTPVRAEVALKIKQAKSDTIDDGGTDTGKQAPLQTSTYTVQEGDRLDTIAYKQLKDAGRWTDIAMMNGIDDPVNLKPGSTLKIPK